MMAQSQFCTCISAAELTVKRLVGKWSSWNRSQATLSYLTQKVGGLTGVRASLALAQLQEVYFGMVPLLIHEHKMWRMKQNVNVKI